MRDDDLTLTDLHELTAALPRGVTIEPHQGERGTVVSFFGGGSMWATHGLIKDDGLFILTDENGQHVASAPKVATLARLVAA